MHISIANAEELYEAKGSKNVPENYVVYNIHINGTYHCSARFSQLSKLHDKLKREFGQGCLEKFPPRHFFYMKPEDTSERRYLLQKYLQRIAQNPNIVNGDTFQSFLLNAQKEVQKGPEEDVTLEVYLCNGKKVAVDILSTDQTDDVLETVCNVLELAPELTYYFALYLVDDLEGNHVVRRLQEFESPYISLSRAEEHQKIQIRKAYFCSDFDKILWEHPIAQNLLYLETISEVKNGHITPHDDAQEQLELLRAERDRRLEYLQLARVQPGYGFIQFGEALSNWPDENSRILVSLGNPGTDSKIVLSEKTGETYDFYVQRMRCWRTYTVDEGVELEFEYLFDGDDGKPKMKWIKLLSASTIHVAMSLQFLVEELVRINQKKRLRIPADRAGTFKPKRAQDRPDLSFITSDQGDEESTATITVKLSELIEKVKADEAEWDSAAAAAERALIEEGLDADEDEDDPRANFASMAGL
eukprot:m.358390 g.358390  ORF g.358390 m.358390 type:complete len:473 (-) comp18138_c0_seq1:706-2124(-)